VLARQRRELPWVAIDKEYRFDADDGARTLADLFDGRSQLMVYHFMYGPSYQAGDPVNSSIADGLDGLLPHLRARDVTLLLVSQAPLVKLQAYKRRMGWSIPWVSAANTDFNFDFGASAAQEPLRPPGPGEDGLPPIVAQNAAAAGTGIGGYLSESPAVSVFTLTGGAVYQTYATTWRGVEFLMSYYRSSTGCRRAATRAVRGRPGSGATTNTTASDACRCRCHRRGRTGESAWRPTAHQRRASRCWSAFSVLATMTCAGWRRSCAAAVRTGCACAPTARQQEGSRPVPHRRQAATPVVPGDV
jgi:predicted dithiol-disulfide oxidoreductase (DUF899 family)